MALKGGWIFCQISFSLDVRYFTARIGSPCLYCYHIAVFIEHFLNSGHFVKFLVGLNDRNQEVKRIIPDLEKDH